MQWGRAVALPGMGPHARPRGLAEGLRLPLRQQQEVGEERTAAHALVRRQHFWGDRQAEPLDPARYRRGERFDGVAGSGARSHHPPDGRIRRGEGSGRFCHPGGIHAHGHDRAGLPGRAGHPR